MAEKNLKRVEAAKARARSLSPEKRTEIARKAVTARWDKVKDIPQASYTGNLTIGDLCLPCAVLSDGTRVLTETDFMEGMGMYRSGALSIRREVDESGARMPLSLAFKNLKPYVERHLGAVHNITLNYRTEKGILANGIKAETIPKICDIWIDADEEIKLGSRQMQIAQRARVMMRALAHVGIISLVDEATGYQRDRTSNALAQILEAFIAKELQAWVKTFPDEYYEQLYRLRNLSFPSDRVKRPQYFGCLTNDIVYKRLAPGVLEELKNTTPRTNSGNRKHRYFQRLDPRLGHPKLREHLASVLSIMKLSLDYQDFQDKLDRIHPRCTKVLPSEVEFIKDDPGVGL